MKLDQLTSSVKDAITVKRVFGEPYEKDGITIIAAASVAGGAGGGGGKDKDGQEGEGGGFGAAARPAGVYVIKGEDVSWRPAVDPHRLAAVAGAVTVVYLLTRAVVQRARAKAASR
jgi:uncharacterized spore protein YtfJ